MGKQKRSKNTYQKINTLFRRDADGIIMPNESFTEPEVEYLAELDGLLMDALMLHYHRCIQYMVKAMEKAFSQANGI